MYFHNFAFEFTDYAKCWVFLSRCTPQSTCECVLVIIPSSSSWCMIKINSTGISSCELIFICIHDFLTHIESDLRSCIHIGYKVTRHPLYHISPRSFL
ncbi:unnamed protein product [Phytomonas sp. Hart1]|nr:unnamed protein product [Phytomonas sp. Hart1]|eukprot:CCW66312.1 unnamed protein product [Phytomonas sp. isolate Hart1]